MTARSKPSSVRILLIDVDDDQRFAVAALFATRGLDDVTQAVDASDGLRTATEAQPDLIVLDLAMPGRSGVDALPDLRQAAPGAAIVVLSNMPRRRLLDEVVRRGAMGFVEKSVQPGRLVDEILVAAALTDVCRDHVLELPASRISPREGRRFVRDLLADADRELVADVELLVSELITNAITHTASEPRLEVHMLRNRIRLEVFDDDPRSPVVRNPDRGQPGGRGLRFVDDIASRWGSSPSGSGKVVWLEIDR